MILSIVIPTYNRSELLVETVARLEREMEWLPDVLREMVELIVCDNASTDDTTRMVAEAGCKYARYKKFDEHLDISGSICRAIDEARGVFVWVFGDDDRICDGYLRPAVERLFSAQPGVAMLYFNRIVLDVSFTRLRSIAHKQWDSTETLIPMSEFIRLYSHWPGFITAMVFRKECYDSGRSYESPRHKGWGFLARIYFGGASGSVWVDHYPAVAQRLGVHSWKADWPRYWLINMPALLHDLEASRVTQGAVSRWRQFEVTRKRLLIDSIVAKVYGSGAMSGFWSEAISYQTGSRRLLLLGIRWLMPCSLARLLYRLQPKYKSL